MSGFPDDATLDSLPWPKGEPWVIRARRAMDRVNDTYDWNAHPYRIIPGEPLRTVGEARARIDDLLAVKNFGVVSHKKLAAFLGLQSEPTAPQSCRTCAFFQPGDTDADPDEIGECRRYAPRPFQHQRQYNFPSWPLVLPCEWCGEYARKAK